MSEVTLAVTRNTDRPCPTMSALSLTQSLNGLVKDALRIFLAYALDHGVHLTGYCTVIVAQPDQHPFGVR